LFVVVLGSVVEVVEVCLEAVLLCALESVNEDGDGDGEKRRGRMDLVVDVGFIELVRQSKTLGLFTQAPHYVHDLLGMKQGRLVNQECG